MTSMFKIEVATRKKVKLMVGFTGPSGSGKTYSALQMAYGITVDWSKITLIDTENNSASYYAHFGEYNTICLSPEFQPDAYDPRTYVKAIEFVEKNKPDTEVLIIDSMSHEWIGCLELLEKVSKASRSGNSYVAWKEVTPLHNAFIDKMRNSKFHVLATMRAVADYVIEENDKGRKTPKKVELKSTQREGVDYEFGILFDLDMANMARTSKDRTGLFANRGPFQITPDTGKELVAWANSGVEVKEEKKKGVYDMMSEKCNEWLAAKLKTMGVPDALAPEVSALLHDRPATDLEEIVVQMTKVTQ